MSKLTSQSLISVSLSFLQTALPLAITYSIISISAFVEIVMLAMLGKNTLAATALSISIYNASMVFMFGFLTATSVFIAESFGAKKFELVGKATAHTLQIALFLGLGLALVLWFTPYTLTLSAQHTMVTYPATSLLHVFALVIITLSILMALQKFFMAIDKAKIIMYAGFIEAIFEIAICYLLIFGKFGLPKLGIIGWGWGLFIAISLENIVLLILIFTQKHYHQFAIKSFLTNFDFNYLKNLCRVSAPTGTLYLMVTLVYIFLAFMMGHVSTDALAAHQIARQYGLLSTTIIIAFSQAITIKVSQKIGQKDPLGIKKMSYVGTITTVLLMIIVAVLYIHYNTYLIALDIKPGTKHLTKVVSYALLFLSIIAIEQIFDALRSSLLGILRAFKDNKVPMLITGVTYLLIGVPFAYLLAFPLKLGGAGLWWGFTISMLVCAILLLLRVRYRSRQLA